MRMRSVVITSLAGIGIFPRQGAQDDTTLVALGRTHPVVATNGMAFWGCGIPRGLYNKLNGRQYWLPTIDVVAFGPDDTSYFVQFTDGSMEWKGLPRELEKHLGNQSSCHVKTLALGDEGSWYCKWCDDSVAWACIPLELHSELEASSLPPVDCLTLGPRGEWFVRFCDGNWRCGGHPDSCIRMIANIERRGGRIVDVLFGHNSQWLITYDEK